MICLPEAVNGVSDGLLCLAGLILRGQGCIFDGGRWGPPVGPSGGFSEMGKDNLIGVDVDGSAGVLCGVSPGLCLQSFPSVGCMLFFPSLLILA